MHSSSNQHWHVSWMRSNGRQIHKKNTLRRWRYDKSFGWQNDKFVHKSMESHSPGIVGQSGGQHRILPVLIPAWPLFPSLPGWRRTPRVWALATRRRSPRWRRWPGPGTVLGCCRWGVRGSSGGAFSFFVHLHVDGRGKIPGFSTLPVAVVAAATAFAGHQLVRNVLNNTCFWNFVKFARRRKWMRRQRLRF